MNKGFLLVLFLAGVSLQLALAAYCSGHPSPNAQPNNNPVWTGTPTFVRSITNAALYTIGSGDTEIPVVHLWGTPYQKGFAHGQLMKDRMVPFINNVWAYLELQVEEGINGTIHWLNSTTLQWIADVGLDVALDITSNLTQAYTGAYYYEEMHGMADATGLGFDMIRRIHMIGELTRGSCSMFGAWGKALGGNGLITMRALDWDVDGPFKNFAQLTVYHPQPNSTENTFVNVGWSGWVGSISGVNDQQMSIHEIGVAFPDASFGQESTSGIPFVYILRDILQFDKTRLDGVSRIAGAQRTCDLILGVGGGKEQLFNSIGYSASACMIMDDKNLKPVASWHPTIENIVYHGMDWLCPGFNQVLHDQLAKYYGAITPQLAIQYVQPIVQTGNLHVYVADLVNMQMWVANAAPDGVSGPAMAYERPYLHVDLNALFAVTPTSHL